MNADKEKIIEKLKKLFALGQSPNQHEAELAMKKASELMTEYQINMTEIDIAEEGGAIMEDYVVDDGLKRNWVGFLGMACAELYDAKCYSRKGSNQLRFVGTKSDIAAAKMTMNHLYQSWKSIVDFDWKNHESKFIENARTAITKNSPAIKLATQSQKTDVLLMMFRRKEEAVKTGL